MNRLVTLVTLAILLVGLVLLGLSDTGVSVADTNIPHNEIADTGVNSSASAVITITMYTVASK